MVTSSSRRRRTTLAVRCATSAVIAVAALVPLAGCQSTAPASGIDPVQARVDESVSQQRQLSERFGGLPADRIDEQLQREGFDRRSLWQRFAGRPADRIDGQLQREASTACVRNVLIEHPDGRWRLECVQRR